MNKITDVCACAYWLSWSKREGRGWILSC